jgi:hypothetical protein
VAHPYTLTPAANDCDSTAPPERLPSLWRARRQAAAGLVAAALRARGLTAGQCARWWQESTWTALERLRGEKPLCAEHLAALPPAVRTAALDALQRAA